MALKRMTYVATLSDGGTATRDATKRAFSHAVEIQRDGRCIAATWHATHALALAEARARRDRDQGVRVVPVAGLPADSAAADAARRAAAAARVAPKP